MHSIDILHVYFVVNVHVYEYCFDNNIIVSMFSPTGFSFIPDILIDVRLLHCSILSTLSILYQSMFQDDISFFSHRGPPLAWPVVV